jgi:hypothetical protein
LLEPDAELDSAFIKQELENRRTAQPDRFYDVTAWSLPYAFRVRAWWTRSAPGASDPIATAAAPAPAAPARGTYGYAFEPGSEGALRLLGGLLADSVRVWFAPRWFRVGDARFARGAFVVRAAANDSSVHALVRRHAGATSVRVVPIGSSLVDEGTDLGSNSVFPLRAPRVALLGGPGVNGNSFGFSWFALDQRLGYPVTTVSTTAVSAALLEPFNVLIVPSAQPGPLGQSLGDGGRQALQAWVRNGGALITLDAATAWLATEQLGLARLRLRRDSTRADSAGGAPLPADVPGAIVRVQGDTLSPLLAGISDPDFPALVFSDRVYTVPKDLRAGEAVVRYTDKARLRLAGYLWPEVPDRLATSPYVWTERAGRGRVIGFAGDPNFRDQWRGLLPLFANAVFMGGSF